MNKYKILFVIAVVGLFGIAIARTGHVAAQIRGYGGSCINNNSSCNTEGLTDMVNIRTLIDTGNIVFQGGITEQDFNESILAKYDFVSSLGELCIPNNYLNPSGALEIFPVNRQGADRNSGPYTSDSSVYDEDGLADLVPRSCGSDRELMEFQPHPLTDYPSYSALCCPSGYAAVSKGHNGVEAIIPAGNRTHQGACCLLPSDQGNNNIPNEYTEENGVFTCYVRNSATSRTPIQYSASQAATVKVIKDNAAQGLSFGTQLVEDPIVGAEQTCNQDSVCALLDSSNEIPNGDVESFQSNGSTIYVTASSYLAQERGESFQCKKCYNVGDPIAIVQEEGTSKLILCTKEETDSDGKFTDSHELVNNNIADTLAVLGADSAENAEFIANCRATGGIPVGIGCIDTTPVGIITGLIRIALGTMGGVALIQLIIVGLRYMQGEEGEIKKAREQLIATLTGLATLIFSVLILRILGVNILDIIPAGTI